MKKLILIFILCCFGLADASNYTLDIMNVDETGANNRIKFAYPGIQYDVRIVASGGAYPFVWELTASPSGMTCDEHTGEITWDSPTATGSPHTVTVTVTDAEGNTDTESYTLTVTDSTDRFIFVATSDDGSPTGSISDPYGSIGDFWTGSNTGKIVYFRTGTHIISDGAKTGARQYSARIGLTSTTPHVFLGYPGETAVINEEYDASWTGTCEDNSTQQDCQAYHFDINGQDDVYFGNLVIDKVGQYGIASTMAGDYATFYKLQFRDAYTSGTSSNQAYISYMLAGTNSNHAIIDCTFGGASYTVPSTYFDGVKLYGISNMVVEDSDFASSQDGLAIKVSCANIYARHNTFDGTSLIIQGYEAGCSDLEVVYNWFDGTYPQVSSDSGLLVGSTYITRNTITGTPYFRYIGSAYGMFTLAGNVIQNTNADSGATSDSSYYRNRCWFRYSANQYGRFTFSDNLLGDSGLVDSSGLLVNRALVGTYGWEIDASEYYGGTSTTPAPPTISNVTISNGRVQ